MYFENLKNLSRFQEGKFEKLEHFNNCENIMKQVRDVECY